jgi:hypothetical protein
MGLLVTLVSLRNIILYVAMYINTKAINIIIITEPDLFYFYGKLSVIQVFLTFCIYLMTSVKLQTSMTIKCRWVPNQFYGHINWVIVYCLTKTALNGFHL